MALSLGISTCPNDTFMFHAIMERRIDLQGLEFAVELRDVQELNRRAAAGVLDVAKVSCYAAASLGHSHETSPAGSAIGFGVGPLLLRRPGAGPLSRSSRVLCPGAMTTAGLLYRSFFPAGAEARNVVFSQIMPALTNGDADYGVVIHEGRFTYRDTGLELEADLGALWEQRHGLPLPLGCVIASRGLPAGVRAGAYDCIRRSIAYGLENREEALVTMRRHAQELDDSVIWSHVELYVNSWSLDLGDEGRRALQAFAALVRGVES